MAAVRSVTTVCYVDGTKAPASPHNSSNFEGSSLEKRIGFCRPRTRTFAILGSDFLGHLEQRRRLKRRALGRRCGAIGSFRRNVGETKAGLPVVSNVPVLGPVLNAFFNPVVLFIIYAAGASRFWGGFGRTTYSNSAPTKVALTALWPALFIVSAAYRSNFKRAVQ